MIRLQLLGGFDLTVDGGRVVVPLRSQRLLALLALRRRRQQRVFVAGTLWMNAGDERASASLRSALFQLQRVPGPLLSVDATSLAIADGVRIDIEEVSEAARQVQAGDCTALYRLADAGDLLPDWYDDWLELDRERIRQRRLHALEAACATLIQARRFPEATEAALAAIAADALRESAHRALVEVHLAEGNVGEARRQYEAYRRLARRQLRAEPSAGLQALLRVA